MASISILYEIKRLLNINSINHSQFITALNALKSNKFTHLISQYTGYESELITHILKQSNENPNNLNKIYKQKQPTIKFEEQKQNGQDTYRGKSQIVSRNHSMMSIQQTSYFIPHKIREEQSFINNETIFLLDNQDFISKAQSIVKNEFYNNNIFDFLYKKSYFFTLQYKQSISDTYANFTITNQLNLLKITKFQFLERVKISGLKSIIQTDQLINPEKSEWNYPFNEITQLKENNNIFIYQNESNLFFFESFLSNNKHLEPILFPILTQSLPYNKLVEQIQLSYLIQLLNIIGSYNMNSKQLLIFNNFINIKSLQPFKIEQTNQIYLSLYQDKINNFIQLQQRKITSYINKCTYMLNVFNYFHMVNHQLYIVNSKSNIVYQSNLIHSESKKIVIDHVQKMVNTAKLQTQIIQHTRANQEIIIIFYTFAKLAKVYALVEKPQLASKHSQVLTKLVQSVKKVSNLLMHTHTSCFHSIIVKSAMYRNTKLIEFLSIQDKQVQESMASYFLKRQSNSIQSYQIQNNYQNLKKRSKLVILLDKISPSHINIAILPNYLNISSQLDDYSLNFLECTNEQRMFAIKIMFQRQSIYQSLNISIDELSLFLNLLRHYYNKRENPFHNFAHGVTVMHGLHYFQQFEPINKFQPIVKFSLVFAGLCHDVDHRATNNQFIINSMSTLAIRFNDKSVLESHHISTTFKLLMTSETNFLKKMNIEYFKIFRKVVIVSILATDMKEHFSILKKTESHIKFIKSEGINNNDMVQELQHQLIGCEIATHCADFFGNVKPFEISQIWSNKVNEEFSAQYKLEEKYGLPQTPFYKDLENMTVRAKGEIGFIKFIVQPLWQIFNQYLNCKLVDIMKNIETSITRWDKLMKQN